MSLKKSIIVISIGVLVLGVSISLMIHSNLGLDPLGAFVSSLSILTTLSYGLMLTCVNICFLIFHFIKNKNIRFSLVGLLMSFTMGLLIDLIVANLHIIPNEMIYQRIILFIIGFLSMCFGIALIQSGRIQKMPFEGFQETLSNIFNKDINVIRVYVEIVLFVIAVILFLIIKFFIYTEVNIFDTINVGSVIIMLCTGPIVGFIFNKIKGEEVNE